MPAKRQRALALISLLALGTGGLRPGRGFPDDPADQASLSTLAPPPGSGAEPTPLYGPASEADYYAATDEPGKRAARNRIVRHRLHGYNQTYSSFKRRLATDGNIVSAGGSLAALALGGLGATTGNIGASNALAAAAAGIVGAQGIVNRDLYFQKTLPALIAQMDASRDRALLAILNGLRQPDAAYSLTDADVDLQRLQDAGSIEGAINTINRDASLARQDAQQAIERKPAYVDERPARVGIGQAILDLDGPRAIAVANAMVPNLGTASPEAQDAANRILPPNRRFLSNQSARARQFLRAWADAETMTPERARLWRDALAQPAI